ncbi:hypothetical protein HWV62_4187 [Athelia sp. TMB]|nr:hypothetical protein HWV62_4187 [Athelia sp. TMB]
MPPTDPKHSIPSFNGKNFSSWQTSMIGIFSFYQVLDIVVGVKPYSDDFETGTDGKIKLDSNGKANTSTPMNNWIRTLLSGLNARRSTFRDQTLQPNLPRKPHTAKMKAPNDPFSK